MDSRFGRSWENEQGPTSRKDRSMEEISSALPRADCEVTISIAKNVLVNPLGEMVGEEVADGLFDDVGFVGGMSSSYH